MTQRTQQPQQTQETQQTKMNTWVVEAHNLYKTFAWTPVLNDISCRIAPAEVVGIFGPNGAGKTTLLRLLATLLTPTAGRLTLFGSAASELTVRRKIGFLGHESYLYPDLTPEENLTFYGKAYQVPNLKDRIAQQLEYVGLQNWRTMPVRYFSRGMEQRLSLARALLHAPDLFLLDEPDTGLDPRGLSTLYATLARAKDRKKTVILTSHDFERNRELYTRALILHRGRIAWQSEATLPSPQEFVELYTACTR